MTEIIAYAAIAYLAVRLGVVIVNLISWPVLKRTSGSVPARVSVLIPARNESNTIGSLLGDLKKSGEQVLEILVYDDDSSDDTADIIRQKATEDGRIRYIKGNGPEPGWLGKNHACHVLAGESKGDYLLFLDADVSVGQGLIGDALSYSHEHHLELLSIFPVQKMKSPGEWLTVPLMNRILLGNLALILIRLLKLSDFSAANGQFMLFRAGTYKKHWYHEKVRTEKVEDIRIMRLMKRNGLKTQTLLSEGQISCRMYRGFGDGISGFSKNIHAFFGKRWLILFLYTFITTAGPIAVGLSMSWTAFMIYIAGLVLFILGVSVLSRQSFGINLILLPLQQFSLLVITVMAAYRQMTGRHYWKGRKIG